MRLPKKLVVGVLAGAMLLATSAPALAGDTLRVGDDPELRVRVEPDDVRVRLH